MTSQKEKMLAGELYDASDPELQAAHQHAQVLLARFNASTPDALTERQQILRELFETCGDGVTVKPNLRVDYGFNVHLGARSFMNYDCVLLDCHRIEIGEDVQMGPGVHIYTASHPLDANQRHTGLELALPVSIGDGVWLGGGTIVCPGVSIGTNTVVGAGSVVVKDLPAGVLAAGNPCRMIREL
jgi:maltose O-acetyltransferase